MPEKKKNLSDISLGPAEDRRSLHFGLVVSEWNPQVTEALASGALATLHEAGIPEKNILRVNVPGSFELPIGAQHLIESFAPDAVICLGCVIQGETRHFEFICQAVANGITRVSLDYGKPVIFGVLTTDTMQQALDRAGGKHGNKGVEAAATAIRMADLFGQRYYEK
jgi:6,7-dimethyl-8-ribityllumazine synthase